MHRGPALVHALSAFVLGTLWFTVLVTLWATGLGLTVTLLGLPVIWLTLAAVREMTAVEAALARELLGARVSAPPRTPGWRLLERLRDRHTWNAHAYLLARFGLGHLTGAVLWALLAHGLVLLTAPLWFWAVPDGIHLLLFRIDTLGEALAAVPFGAALIAAGWWAAGPYARLWRRLAERLLGPDAAPLRLRPRTGRVLGIALFAQAVCLVIWAATDRGTTWPVWTAFGLGTWVAYTAADTLPEILGVTVGMNVVIWALTGLGYFWPVWVALGASIVYVIHRLTRDSERLGQLTRTRAEVVGAQEDELRRIERDLHDGAQARLVALSMSLGLAESRLDDDPERARELMGEAQEQARTALKELRDLARGIAPPVLQDRGLTAAIEALTATSPLRVEVRGDGGRAPAAIGRAGYFVAAEALANAAKHAAAARVRVGVTRFDDRLEVEVADDGRGGADPRGSGLTGLRRRVEAVDGRLEVRSTATGTIVRASLPCASS